MDGRNPRGGGFAIPGAGREGYGDEIGGGNLRRAVERANAPGRVPNVSSLEAAMLGIRPAPGGPQGVTPYTMDTTPIGYGDRWDPLWQHALEQEADAARMFMGSMETPWTQRG